MTSILPRFLRHPADLEIDKPCLDATAFQRRAMLLGLGEAANPEDAAERVDRAVLALR